MGLLCEIEELGQDFCPQQPKRMEADEIGTCVGVALNVSMLESNKSIYNQGPHFLLICPIGQPG